MRNRERTWEATRAAARLLGELVSARRGEALWLRDYPAAVDGDVGRVVLGVAHRGVHRSCAVVSDLGATISISVEEQRQGASVLRAFRGNEPGVREAAETVAAALEAAFGPSALRIENVIENGRGKGAEGGIESGVEGGIESGIESGTESGVESGDAPSHRGSSDERVTARQREERDERDERDEDEGPPPPSREEDERAFRRHLRLLGAASTKDQRPGLLDAGYAVLDGLGQQLAIPEGRWRLELWGEDGARSGASVSLVGGPHAWEHLVAITAGRDGAVLTVPGAAMGAADHALRATTVAALAGLLGNVASLVRQAVDGRAGYRARPLSALRTAHHLAEALRAARVARVTAAGGSDEGFPRRWPRAQVVERGERGDYPLVELEEGAPAPGPPSSAVGEASGPFVAIAIDDYRARIFDEAGLAPLLPELVARAAARATRITPERLALEQVYEVLEPFNGVPRGAKLRYAACHSDPRGEQYEYRFLPLGGGGPVSLVDYRDGQILRQLHRYLARAA